MPDEANLDFLELVLTITANADKAVATIDRRLAENGDQDEILVKVEGLMKIRTYLAAQSMIIRATVEHQQGVREDLLKLVEQFDQQ